MAVNQSAYQLLMGGLRNMFQQPQTAPNASIYDLARADAQRQAMTSLGAGLVGAAVPQTPLMRAQALQNAFANVGNTSANVYNAAQMRLAEKQYNDEQAARTRMTELLESSLGGAMPQAAPAAAVPSVSMPSVAPMMDGGFSRAANVSPVQAIIANPPPPTVSAPGGMATPMAGTTGAARPLTQAQIQKVRGLQALGKTEDAVKQLFDFQYENAQPYKPQGEFAKNIQDMQNMNLPQEQIDQYKSQYLYGKLEGLAAIDADPRIPADTKKLMREAEIRKLESEGLDYLGVQEMQIDGVWQYVQPSKTGGDLRVLGPSPGPTQEYYTPVSEKQPDGTYAYIQYPKSGKSGGTPINRGPAPSPGEEEAAKKAAERKSEVLSFQPKATAAVMRAETKAANVIETGRKALEIIRNNPKGVTGITGKLAQVNPKADAYQLKKYLETIQANVGFNELAAMKQESPSGSGLGQVAVQELTSLQATQGNLEIGQSAEALESALINIINSTDALIESARNGYIKDYGADLIGTDKLYDLTGVYDIPENAAETLRQNADDVNARRAFDRQFGMGASKFVLGAQ